MYDNKQLECWNSHRFKKSVMHWRLTNRTCKKPSSVFAPLAANTRNILVSDSENEEE